MKRVNRTLVRLALALSVVLGTAATGVPNASATAPTVCGVFGEHAQGVSRLQMFCQGTDEFAGLWDLQMADGLVSGTGPGNRTLSGTYTEIPNCTIRIGIHIYKCFYIYAQVCVNGFCVWVRIVVCIRVDVDVCIWVYTTSTGEALISRDDTGLQAVQLPSLG